MSCGGADVYKWNDGHTSHDASWGIETDLSICEEECHRQPECEGFDLNKSTKVCGHWKRGPLKHTKEHGKELDCYKKKKGFFVL